MLNNTSHTRSRTHTHELAHPMCSHITRQGYLPGPTCPYMTLSGHIGTYQDLSGHIRTYQAL